jgi:2',3'-cyclic-nucleotide 2'-phosphodiesterase (5'-nucleotidase family)
MNRILLFLSVISFAFACRTTPPVATKTAEDGKIEVVFLQLNDVYEIAPLEGGKVGGMARVATIKKQLQEKNPHTFAVLAGDFLNPSVIGTLKYEGSRIAGKQMIDVMNTAKIDLVTFGNHEFDLSEADLLKRLKESKSGWVSSNVGHRTAKGIFQFAAGADSLPIPQTWVIDAQDEDGTSLKIGVIGLTLPSNQKDYVFYEDFYKAAAKAYQSLQSTTDFVVGLTHLTIDEDKEVSRRLPGIKLIMGGHEHDHMYHQVGSAFIAKADANAKTVYVHTLLYNKTSRQLTIQSNLRAVDSTVAPDPATEAVVKKWTTIADNSFKELGLNPQEVIMVATQPLDGREVSIRHHTTNLTELILQSVSASAPKADLAILNSGSIRIDDQLSGNITQYDIIRTLPFGGSIVEVEMKGDLLLNLLNIGKTNEGSGGFLLLDRVQFDAAQKTWLVKGKPILAGQTYRVAMPSFLMTGGEKNLEFLKHDHPGVLKVYQPDPANTADLRNDIRTAIIAFLKARQK